MSHNYESWYNSVSWVDDEETRLKAAYWANIVTYRIFTRALGAIGKFHFRWSNITRVSTRLKKKFSKFDMVRVFTRPRKIFLGRVEILIKTKFKKNFRPYEYLTIKIFENLLRTRKYPNHKKRVETLPIEWILQNNKKLSTKWFNITYLS